MRTAYVLASLMPHVGTDQVFTPADKADQTLQHSETMTSCARMMICAHITPSCLQEHVYSCFCFCFFLVFFCQHKQFLRIAIVVVVVVVLFFSFEPSIVIGERCAVILVFSVLVQTHSNRIWLQ